MCKALLAIEEYTSWDNRRKRLANDRRVAIIVKDYVVIIRIYRKQRADFVTAFVAGRRTIRQIRTNPLFTVRWPVI